MFGQLFMLALFMNSDHQRGSSNSTGRETPERRVEWRVSVRDGGVGISEQQQAMLFRPYTQVVLG